MMFVDKDPSEGLLNPLLGTNKVSDKSLPKKESWINLDVIRDKSNSFWKKGTLRQGDDILWDDTHIQLYYKSTPDIVVDVLEEPEHCVELISMKDEVKKHKEEKSKPEDIYIQYCSKFAKLRLKHRDVSFLGPYEFTSRDFKELLMNPKLGDSELYSGQIHLDFQEFEHLPL